MATDISVELLWFGVYGRSFENIESLFSLQTLHDKEAASQLPTSPRRFNNFRQEKYIDKARNLGKKILTACCVLRNVITASLSTACNWANWNEASVQVYLYACCLLSINTLKHPHMFFNCYSGSVEAPLWQPTSRLLCALNYAMLFDYAVLSPFVSTYSHVDASKGNIFNFIK